MEVRFILFLSFDAASSWPTVYKVNIVNTQVLCANFFYFSLHEHKITCNPIIIIFTTSIQLSFGVAFVQITLINISDGFGVTAIM